MQPSPPQQIASPPPKERRTSISSYLSSLRQLLLHFIGASLARSGRTASKEGRKQRITRFFYLRSTGSCTTRRNLYPPADGSSGKLAVRKQAIIIGISLAATRPGTMLTLTARVLRLSPHTALPCYLRTPQGAAYPPPPLPPIPCC